MDRTAQITRFSSHYLPYWRIANSIRLHSILDIAIPCDLLLTVIEEID